MNNVLLKYFGYLNFIIFQWFFTRLTAHFDDSDKLTHWSFRFYWPLTKWVWKNEPQN